MFTQLITPFYDEYDDYAELVDNEDELDDYINSRGGIDKCMNCGKYRYNDELNYSPQVCMRGCKNPNEY